MINRRELVRALRDRTIGHWVVVEHAQDIAIVDELRDVRRRERRTRTTLVIHHDVTRGRGSVTVTASASDGRADAFVDQAVALASSAVGPTWKTIPPAAPAKVDVLDPKLGELDDRAAQIVHDIKRPDGTSVLARASVMREQTFVHAKTGFRDDWLASRIQVQMLVAAADRSIEIARDSRLVDDLELDEAVVTAATDLRDLAGAAGPTGGRCNLVLGVDALLHGEGTGVWHVFAAQADSIVERQGLSRYRLNTPIADGAEQASEPLWIASDGALAFATLSAPVGDEGDAIRRFPIIERGISVGVGLTMREAALRKRDPNGGVRNLVVRRGTWDGSIAGAGSGGTRTVAVRRLRALSIDRITGHASLEIALAVDHSPAGTKLFTGGTVRLDLVTALAHARRTQDTVKRGSYDGPLAVLIEDVELIA